MHVFFRTALMSFLCTGVDDQVYSREEALFSAVKAGDLARVQANIDIARYARDKQGNTALCCALVCGKLAIAEYLIKRVPELHREGSVVVQECRIPGSRGWEARYDIKNVMPLHLAVWWGYDKIVYQLLSSDVAVNAKDELGRTPLHYAAAKNRHQLVPMLLAAGAEVNARAPKLSTYSTPLKEAISVGACQSMGVLIDHGAEVDAEVVKCACHADQFVSVKYLNEKVGFLIKEGEDEVKCLTEMLVAAKYSPEIMGYILNQWMRGAHDVLAVTYQMSPSKEDQRFCLAIGWEVETERRRKIGLKLLKERNEQLREKILLLELPNDLVKLLMLFVADPTDLDAALRFAEQNGQDEMVQFLRSIGASEGERADCDRRAPVVS